jgi:hypothetical protein
MSNPWDVPPLPERGDDDADDTYKMIGRALTDWENLEVQLAHLYASFTEQPNRLEAFRAYGGYPAGSTIFAVRVAQLKKVAAAYFVNFPSQPNEGEFDDLMDRAQRLADRRNEIAHSVVDAMQWDPSLRPLYKHLIDEPAEFCAIPSYYTHRKFDASNRPAYAYTSKELIGYALAFRDLGTDCYRFAQRIFGKP